ncbi:MAG: cytochrome c oxidase subunit 3, partial [Solirubrobacteraceae bacterium]
PGEPGIWVVIVGDVVVFVILFGLFLHYQGEQPEQFAASQSRLEPGFGFINTVWLLVSSLAVVIGVNAVRLGRTVSADRAFRIAFWFGVAFVVTKGIEWGLKIDAGYVPHTDDFFMLYYVLAGLHLLHVFVGLLVLSLVRRAARRPLTGVHDRQMIESGAVFWHMVDLLWLVLFPLLYFVH